MHALRSWVRTDGLALDDSFLAEGRAGMPLGTAAPTDIREDDMTRDLAERRAAASCRRGSGF